MLKRLLTPLVPLPAQSTRLQAEKQEDAAAPEAFAFLSAVAAAMPSLDPPPAATDSPMAQLIRRSNTRRCMRVTCAECAHSILLMPNLYRTAIS